MGGESKLLTIAIIGGPGLSGKRYSLALHGSQTGTVPCQSKRSGKPSVNNRGGTDSAGDCRHLASKQGNAKNKNCGKMHNLR